VELWWTTCGDVNLLEKFDGRRVLFGFRKQGDEGTITATATTTTTTERGWGFGFGGGMHERSGVRMADKRRYFERDSREKEAANSGSEASRQSKGDDDPPNSRLFILCGRNVSEDELRESFDKFGSIKELWIVKDKVSQESKGKLIVKLMSSHVQDIRSVFRNSGIQELVF